MVNYLFFIELFLMYYHHVESDYSIFTWRQKSESQETATPTLYLHNPKSPYPSPPDYMNPSYYAFRRHTSPMASGSSRGSKSARSLKSRSKIGDNEQNGVPSHKVDFMKFHNENGVRTVTGSVGPVKNGERLKA